MYYLRGLPRKTLLFNAAIAFSADCGFAYLIKQYDKFPFSLDFKWIDSMIPKEINN